MMVANYIIINVDVVYKAASTTLRRGGQKDDSIKACERLRVREQQKAFHKHCARPTLRGQPGGGGCGKRAAY
jgi:hypothetical protein